MSVSRQSVLNPESLFSKNPQSVQEAYLKTRPAKAKSLWDFLRRYIPFRQDMLVFSPGSSYAVYESEFQKLCKCVVVASDIDRGAICHFRHDNLLKAAADAVHPPFKEGSFDVILLPQVLEHIHDYKACIASLDALLKPGGFIYVHVPNPWSLVYPPLLGQSWLKCSPKNWHVAVIMAINFYVDKLRGDYLANRVTYHAGYTREELLGLFPGYEVRFLFWERVLSQYHAWPIRRLAAVAGELPKSVQALLELETYLIAQKPMNQKI